LAFDDQTPRGDWPRTAGPSTSAVPDRQTATLSSARADVQREHGNETLNGRLGRRQSATAPG